MSSDDQQVPGPQKSEVAGTSPMVSSEFTDSAPELHRGSRRQPWVIPTLTGVLGFLLGVGVVGGAVAMRTAAIEREEEAAAEAAALAEVAEAEAAEQAEAAARAARAAILPDALDACGVAGSDGLELGDGDLSLTFDMRGEDDYSGATYIAIACVLDQLDIPSSIDSHIGQTTSMDGRQTAEWGDLTISWSYHPDRGLDGVLTVTGG